MGKYNYKDQGADNPSSTKGPHPEYAQNLRSALTFIRNVTPNLVAGMRVYVASSQWLKDALLVIAWTPAPEVKLGKFAAPINLHDSNQEVLKKIESVFNNYVNMAKRNNGP